MILPYTVIYVCVSIQSRAGMAYYVNTWIADTRIFSGSGGTYTDWLLSSQSSDVYRANGVTV